MKKFRSIPALMTLIAGFITSVIMIIHKYSLVHFLWTLVAVMAGFYIAGMLLIFILNKVFKDKKENEENDAKDDGDESDSLLDQFMNNPYPDNIKEKAKEEIKRLEMMPSISSEASVIRSYLDWLSKVPYWQESQDNCDIKSIKEILDQDHYGIKKVKERILEYIAVKNMTGSLKAPILCLYGPPGVGKTS